MRRALPRHLADRGVLVLIDRVVFDRGEGRIGTLEAFALRRVDRTAPVEVEIWGARVRATRLDVSSDMEVDGAPVRTRPVPVSGQMVHGNIVFHLDRLEMDVATFVDEYRRHSEDPDLRRVAESEWEQILEGLSSGVIDLDPLVFSEGKLIAKVVGESRSFEEFGERIRAWLTEQILHHEAFHVRDLGAGRLGLKEPLPSSARSMRGWLNRWDVRHELGAYLTGARCTAERDSPLELLTLLSAAKDPAKPAATRMARYAMLGAILGEIAEDPSRFPSVRIRDRPAVGAPKQIAGQLYRLTPGEVHRALDAAYSWYEERGGELDVPIETPIERLYGIPRRWRPLAWIAGLLAAALAFLLWRGARRARTRNTVAFGRGGR